MDKAIASAHQQEGVRNQQAVVREENESQSVDNVHIRQTPLVGGC